MDEQQDSGLDLMAMDEDWTTSGVVDSETKMET